jgi:hypothetical protein
MKLPHPDDQGMKKQDTPDLLFRYFDLTKTLLPFVLPD